MGICFRKIEFSHSPRKWQIRKNVIMKKFSQFRKFDTYKKDLLLFYDILYPARDENVVFTKIG